MKGVRQEQRRTGGRGGEPSWNREGALFAPLPRDAGLFMDVLPSALAAVRPLSGARRDSLPEDVFALSRILTAERGGLSRSYWIRPAFVSAYLYYFLPWNILRLARLLAALPLPEPAESGGAQPLLVDVGSGPLSLPLALWLARPAWREARLRVVAQDCTAQPLALGKSLFEALGVRLGWKTWPVETVRGPLERAFRGVPAVGRRGDVWPWLITAANVLNEFCAGARGGRRSFRNSTDGDDGEFSGERVMPRLDALLQALFPLYGMESPVRKALPAALFVEPGTRFGGKLIMRLRVSALRMGLRPLAPCPHKAACPLLSGSGARAWCHFTFGVEGAPEWLRRLSEQAGLAKRSLSMSPLLLSAGEGGESDGFAPAARVLSAPFAVPGLSGQARYACTGRGLALLENATTLASGDLVRFSPPRDAIRDRKSGAFVVRPPGFRAS